MIWLLYELAARVQDLTELKFTDFIYDEHAETYMVSWYNKKTHLNRKAYLPYNMIKAIENYQ